MPASETVDFEREFGELVRELRALPTPSAPQNVRERVRALGEPAERRRRLALRRPSRRIVLVLVPVCVLAVVAAAVVHGLVSSSSSRPVVVGRPPSATKPGETPRGTSVHG